MLSDADAENVPQQLQQQQTRQNKQVKKRRKSVAAAGNPLRAPVDLGLDCYESDGPEAEAVPAKPLQPHDPQLEYAVWCVAAQGASQAAECYGCR